MRVEAFSKDETESEKVVKLLVRTYKNGNTYLIAVDDEGEELTFGKLLRISPLGLHLMSSVDPTLGFPMDDKGRLKVL